MFNEKKIIIAGDQHIGSYGDCFGRVKHFLLTVEADLLLLGGDLFDLYIMPPKEDLFKYIQQNKNIKKWAYIVGNHDKDINKYFPDLPTYSEYWINDDIVVTHGHQWDQLLGTWDKFFVRHQYFIENAFNVNLQKFFRRAFKPIVKYALRNLKIKAKETYPNKLVICGHSHLPEESPPYYNWGCQCDGIFSYISITVIDKSYNIKLIKE